MKKFILLLSISLFLYSCNNSATPTSVDENGAEYFGETINKENAIASSEFFNNFSSDDSIQMKLTGEVKEVCKKKGCWMSMNIGSEDDAIFVKFKNYDFFVPLNCEGRAVTIEGWAYKEVQSIEELKHYAFDAGDSEEEIAAITEPEVSYTFMANGVILD